MDITQKSTAQKCCRAAVCKERLFERRWKPAGFQAVFWYSAFLSSQTLFIDIVGNFFEKKN